MNVAPACPIVMPIAASALRADCPESSAPLRVTPGLISGAAGYAWDGPSSVHGLTGGFTHRIFSSV
jgi:hypothetical protein